MKTEVKIILAIMEGGSWGYNLDEKTNIGKISFKSIGADEVTELRVDPVDFERAYLIREIMCESNKLDAILACKTVLMNHKSKS